MNRKSSMRRCWLLALVIAGAGLVAPAFAWAHAEISPKVSLSGKLQLYSLAVPTEKSGLTTAKVVMTVPAGFGIDSFVPPPAGWTQQVQQSGAGGSAVITRVTWTGGKTPTGEDSLFQVPGAARIVQDVHVRGAADVLRRVDRELGGRRVLGGAGSDY